MATLAFTLDGQSYASDVFSGGNVVQLAFPTDGTQVLFVETRLGATLPWKTIDSRVIERDLVVNIPFSGEGQEFRLNCIAEPSAAEIIPMVESGGGSQPGPNTVGTEQIVDGAVEEQDLNDSVKDRMTVTYDASTGGLRLGGYAQAGNVPANSQDVGQGGGEDSDDNEAGFDTGAENGDEDI